MRALLALAVFLAPAARRLHAKPAARSPAARALDSVPPDAALLPAAVPGQTPVHQLRQEGRDAEQLKGARLAEMMTAMALRKSTQQSQRTATWMRRRSKQLENATGVQMPFLSPFPEESPMVAPVDGAGIMQQLAPQNTTSATGGITMSTFRNLDFKVKKWRRPLSFAGGNDSMPQALMIAPQRLYNAKAPILWELGFDPHRVAPVHTDRVCIGDEPARTGVFLAHQAAWDRVAKLGQKALVLEADWSVGDLSSENAAHLSAQLHELWNRTGDDLTKVGSCGSLCNTAYFLGPRLAGEMAQEDPCNHNNGTDAWVREMCYNETEIAGRNINCHIVSGGSVYAESQGLYGTGLIFQDRFKIKGLHDANNDGQYNLTSYDTY